MAWPTITDDVGDGVSGSIFCKALTDAIKAYIDAGDGGGGAVDWSAMATVVSIKDHEAAALDFKEATNSYLKFVTTNGGEKLVLGKKFEAGAVEIEGSAFDINGGTIASVTLDGAIAGGDQAITNVGDVTFHAASVIKSGSTNGNTLLLAANDTTFITLTTGSPDTLGIGAFSLSGKLTAGANEIEGSAFDIDGGTIASVTLDGAIAGGDQSWTDVGNMTFHAGSILKSGPDNGNTLLLKADDSTCITLTTGAPDTIAIAHVTSFTAVGGSRHRSTQF